MPKVSVIIPVYNVERYIERCLHSLFCQTLDDIEYVFIDDGTPDNSIRKIFEVLKQYPHRKPQAKILFHSENRGVSVARGTGIKAAIGDYVIHCDPDDYIEPNMYELMYSEAITKDLDIVTCGFYVETATSNSVQNISFKGSPIDYLKTGIKSAFSYASLCNKLIRRDIFEKHKIIPYAGCDYGEDLGCVMRILYYAQSLSFISIPLYHYCHRPTSITGTHENLYVYHTRIKLVDNICNFFEGKGFDTLCNALKFNTKLAGRHLYEGNEKEWVSLYKECHGDIFKFSDNTLKARLVWWIALRNVWSYKFMKKVIKNF